MIKYAVIITLLFNAACTALDEPAIIYSPDAGFTLTIDPSPEVQVYRLRSSGNNWKGAEQLSVALFQHPAYSESGELHSNQNK
jgi:hypothetical protein